MRNVLSLFDGGSCLQIALKMSRIPYDQYFASEINESAIAITQANFPDTIQIGDVRQVKAKDLPKIWLLSAGSPCQDFSISGTRRGMVTAENFEVTSLKQYLQLKRAGVKFIGQSYLFWEFIRLVRELKPKYFFFENVAKMDPKWKYIISRELGVLPVEVNSSIMTAQNRVRLYWTNIHVLPFVEKDVRVGDIIPNAIGGYGVRGRKSKTGNKKWDMIGTTRKDGKINCLTTRKHNHGRITLKNGSTRYLTVEEAEVIQTLPKGYTDVDGLSEAERWHMIGNGWTPVIVAHFLKGLKKDLVKK